MSATLIGSAVVVAIAAIHAYALYYVFRLEERHPTEHLVPEEP